MIFVDTGGWFAAVVSSDQHHDDATRWLTSNRQPLMTSDYVVDESLTLLRIRGYSARASTLGEALFSSRLARIYYLTEEDVLETWRVFERYSDKDWSFTDCSSRVVMERLGINTAFAFDHHFRQFGSIHVVPS
jgi:predicted nucleic acid-binding protein